MTDGVEWKIERGDWRTHAEQSAAARRLLCRLLGEEVAVEHDACGAPFLPQHRELYVSISHCRTAVAVAVSNRGPVGIDVESRRRIGEGLVERVCSDAEKAEVRASADPTMAFLRLWTRKEAALKLRGTGIRGFSSMVNALASNDITTEELPCTIADTVASLAVANDE